VVVITRTGFSKLVNSCKEDFDDSTKLSLSGMCLQYPSEYVFKAARCSTGRDC